MKRILISSFLLLLIIAVTFTLCSGSETSKADGKTAVSNALQTNSSGNDQQIENQKSDPSKKPVVFFPEPKFQFDKIIEGQPILHDFVIMNKGADTLLVQRVKTSCGCTTVSYTREIPPGGEGKISMKVNTRGYGGRDLLKTITVMTNDSKQPEYKLSVAGNVEKFVTILPPVLRLNGEVGKELKSVIKIIPEKKYPFVIEKVTAQDGKNIKYNLEESKNAEGQKEYAISVENIKQGTGAYYDVLTVETDSTIQPEIKINVMTRIIDSKNASQPPVAGGNGTNLFSPEKEKTTGTDANSANSTKGKNFLEVIKQIQEQNKNGTSQSKTVEPKDPKQAEELKKKFEALIKEAQEKKKAQEKESQQNGTTVEEKKAE